VKDTVPSPTTLEIVELLSVSFTAVVVFDVYPSTCVHADPCPAYRSSPNELP
jgi:hypothetical protein